MLELNFTSFPTLYTERLCLRAVKETDVSEMLFLRSDERVMKYIDKTRLKSEEEALALIARIQQLLRDAAGINWAITLKGEDTLLGTVGLFQFDKEHYRCELGYMIHPDYQGKGLVQEALRCILGFAFGALHIHSVEANVNPDNAASIKLLNRIGFVREAYFRENFYFEGKFLDSAIYCLLCSDFSSVAQQIAKA